MGNLTKNISRYELACSCGCGEDTVDFETIMVVQDACDHFSRVLDKKVTLEITSANRCLEYNRSDDVGSNDNSQHPKGRALDIKILEVSPQAVYDYLTERHPLDHGFGLYSTFVHVDTRSDKVARW
jgi:uncharacterized protein YcbK (DUF882 family)